MRKILLSLLSVLIGWAVGFAYFILSSYLLSSWQKPIDMEAILFWTAIFVLVAWFIFVIPYVFLVNESNDLFDLRWAPIIGALSGLIAFILLVGGWTDFWEEPLYLGYAVVIGATSALCYSALLKAPRRETDTRKMT
jgi:hypothetical protein